MKRLILLILFISFNSFAELKTCPLNGKNVFYPSGERINNQIIYNLVTPAGTAKVILKKFNSQSNEFNLSGNCFSFASHQKRNIPGDFGNGKSPVNYPDMVNRNSFLKAMAMEEAIFLGTNPTQSKAIFDVTKKYYLLASFIKREEYHF